MVTATTLLLKWYARVHDWASKEHLWGAELVSQAGYSCYYGEKCHFYYPKQLSGMTIYSRES